MKNQLWMLAFGTLLLVVTAPVSAGWSPLGGPVEPEVELQLDPSRPELLYARVVVSERKHGRHMAMEHRQGHEHVSACAAQRLVGEIAIGSLVCQFAIR